MTPRRCTACAGYAGGFTLLELLTAMLILSLLALMSYRALGAVLDAREHVAQETEKWRSIAAFLARFERDVQLAAPRPVRAISGTAPAFSGEQGTASELRVQFSRFASPEGTDTARRQAYGLNTQQEIELWLWPGLDVAPDAQPVRYPMLRGVAHFDLQYLSSDRAWLGFWPARESEPPLPLAVRLRLVLTTGEEILRVFALKS